MTTQDSSIPTHFTDATQEERLAAMEGVLSNGVIPQLTNLALSIKQGKLDEWASSVAEAWTEDSISDEKDEDAEGSISASEKDSENIPLGTYF